MAWSPSPHSTYVEVLTDPEDAAPGSLLIEHFNDPFVAAVRDGSEDALREAAEGYLRELFALPHLARTRDRLPAYWRRALVPEPPSDRDTSCFGWLPIAVLRTQG